MKKIVMLLIVIGIWMGSAFSQVPDFTTTDCNGNTYHLYDDLAAGKAVVLKFCAIWCQPCNISNPPFEALYKEYGSGNCNVKFYSMLYESATVGIPATCAQTAIYKNNFHLTMPVLNDIGGWGYGITGSFVSAFGIEAIPTTLIIVPNQADPANSTVGKIVGAFPDLDEQIKTILENGGYPSAKFTMSGLCANPPYAGTLTSNRPTGNLWSTGETSQTITVDHSGDYTLTIYPGCSYTQTVTFNPPVAVGTISSTANSMCDGGYFTLNYAEPSTQAAKSKWLWRTGPDQDFFDLSDYTGSTLFKVDPQYGLPGRTLEFVLESSNDNGSCATRTNILSVPITSNAPTLLEGTATSSQSTVCADGHFTLNYTGGIAGSVWEYYQPSYIWYLPGTWVYIGDASQPLDPVANGFPMFDPGDYHFRVASPTTDCYTISNEVVVTVYPNTLAVEGNASSCGGTNVTLQLNGTYTDILWSTGASTSSIVVNPPATTTYTVNAKNEHGCANYASFTLNIWEKIFPIISTNSPGTVCPSTPITLEFTGTKSGTPCTYAEFGQWPEDTYNVTSCDGNFENITEEGYLSEYSLVNVQAGKYYHFMSSSVDGYPTPITVTITNADGSTVYAYGLTAAIWKASYTGTVRMYTHGPNCSSENFIFFYRTVACYSDASNLGTFLWMPGGQTTPSITVNPAATTDYTLTFKKYSENCSASSTKKVLVGIESVERSTTNVTINSATFKWSTPNDPAQWTLRYKTTNLGGKWVEVTLPGTSRSYTAAPLLTNQNYMWQLRGKCGNKWTDYSGTLGFITNPLSNRPIIVAPEVVMQNEDEPATLTVQPNPSTTNFRITIGGNQNKQRVQLTVTDMMGRIIEKRNVVSGNTIILGDNYKPGAYLVNLIQGKTSQQIKILKFDD